MPNKETRSRQTFPPILNRESRCCLHFSPLSSRHNFAYDGRQGRGPGPIGDRLMANKKTSSLQTFPPTLNRESRRCVRFSPLFSRHNFADNGRAPHRWQRRRQASHLYFLLSRRCVHFYRGSNILWGCQYAVQISSILLQYTHIKFLTG